MKANRFLILAFLIITCSVISFTGCKYDIAEPMWEKPYNTPPSPQITQIDPASEALPGVNIITITGQNLVIGTDTTLVFFDGDPADVVSVNATQIVVRRPNIGGNTTIKIVPHDAIAPVKISYKVDQVLLEYGSFLDNNTLNTISVDKNENVYIIDGVTRNITKIDPNQVQTVVGSAANVLAANATDAVIGPDGRLYCAENKKFLERVDLNTGVIDTVPLTKFVKAGDFDANGYFYTMGKNTDIVVLNPDLTTKVVGATNKYSSQDILSLRIAGGFLYIACRPNNNTPAKIYRHPINNGEVGDQELLYDMASDTTYSSQLVRAIGVSASGKLFVTTDGANPLLTLDPATKHLDIFYKSIVPAVGKQFSWGNGNLMYMITGDGTTGRQWKVYRVDIGESGSVK